ncbi:MAG: hypothetical protein IPG25_05430 [Proteobacteria bacterium]|nr:hypothetical protein [Pseudomonadota bacterium]
MTRSSTDQRLERDLRRLLATLDPTPVLAPTLPLTPPASASALPWQEIALTAGEIVTKQGAIEAHHGQMEVMTPFLHSFMRPNELFAAPR